MEVTINPEQKLYVLKIGSGYSCFGFENARKDTQNIAKQLKRDDLAFTNEDFGSPTGYHKYLAAVQAWAQSTKSKTTYFEPGTPAKVAKILEKYRDEHQPIRLFLGNTETGQDWYSEP